MATERKCIDKSSFESDNLKEHKNISHRETYDNVPIAMKSWLNEKAKREK